MGKSDSKVSLPNRMKGFWISLVVAAAGEAWVYSIATNQFSRVTQLTLAIGWCLGTTALGYFTTSAVIAYCGSVVLASPVISYSLLDPAGLEMGGLIHVLIMGAYGSIPFLSFGEFGGDLVQGKRGNRSGLIFGSDDSDGARNAQEIGGRCAPRALGIVAGGSPDSKSR